MSVTGDAPQEPVAPAPAPVLCRDCQRELSPPNARKCVTCDSYQDWRGVLPVSHATLSLIIALLSIATVLLPVVRQTFTVNDSDLSIRALRTREGKLDGFPRTFEIEALVTNSGTRTGTITAVFLGFDHPVACGVRPELRRCGGQLLGTQFCEMVYLVSGKQLDGPTTRLLPPAQTELAELHYLEPPERLPNWVSLRADVLHFGGREECIDVDLTHLKAGQPDRSRAAR